MDKCFDELKTYFISDYFSENQYLKTSAEDLYDVYLYKNINLYENPIHENQIEIIVDCKMDLIYDDMTSFLYEKVNEINSENDLMIRIHETFCKSKQNSWFSLEKNNETIDVNDMISDVSFLFVTGSFTNQSINVERYDFNTNVWDKLSNVIDFIGYSLEYDSEKQFLFVGGKFSNIGSHELVYANNIAKYDCINNTWESLQQGLNDDCLCMAYNKKTECLFVGGNFTTSGHLPMNYFGIYDLSNSLWKSIPGGDINAPCRTICIDESNQLIYIGGDFTEVGHSKMTANYVAIYNIITDSWSELRDGMGGSTTSVRSICLDTISQCLYVGGNFSTAGSVPVNNIAKYNISSKTWESFGGVNNTCNTLNMDSFYLYAGGEFTHILSEKNEYSPFIAKYDIIKSSWCPFSESGLNAICKKICAREDDLYVGGSFTKAGHILVNGLVGYHKINV